MNPDRVPAVLAQEDVSEAVLPRWHNDGVNVLEGGSGRPLLGGFVPRLDVFHDVCQEGFEAVEAIAHIALVPGQLEHFDPNWNFFASAFSSVSDISSIITRAEKGASKTR